MKESISLINQSIAEKHNRLIEKAERNFENIVIPSLIPLPISSKQTKAIIPPISYLLYGVAGLAAIGAIITKPKLLCLGIAAVCAYYGYRTSKSGETSNSSTNPISNSDINSIKTEVTTKVVDAVKSIVKEWEEFMELKQKEVRRTIDACTCNDVQKDSMRSRVYVYEIIDISLSDFANMIKDVNDVETLKLQVSAYKSKLIKAIDDAASRQSTKYLSILEIKDNTNTNQ